MVQEIDGERFYTIREAAVRVRRNPKTVWRWTVEGKIDFYQPSVNCKILIPESALKLKQNF